MPTMIKPRTLGVLTKVERLKTGPSLIVTAFGQFDLARPDAPRFETDQAMWVMAAKALPRGSVLDIGMPKPTGELLVGGSAVVPDGAPVPAMMLEWLVGPLHKRVAVLGDRYWQVGAGGATQTEPQPFVEMKLDPERCFGGPGHPDNPVGVGYRSADRIQAREAAPLPNLEFPDQMIRSIDQTPAPASCGPMDLASPRRRRYAGTYDANWIKTAAPGLPDDVDPRLFLAAPEDQQFPEFIEGGEPYALRGFCKDHAVLRGTLPQFRVRAFLGRKPADAEAAGDLCELTMRIDTLWLIAGARRGVLVYRGALAIEDMDAEDVSHVMLAYEHGGDPPRPPDHYREVWRLRADPAQSFKYAFAERQLAPNLTPGTARRRDAERRELQRARLENHAAGQRWMIERLLRQSNVPAALWPAIPAAEADPSLLDFPIPTPEEIEEGDIDLAAMLDAADALYEQVARKAEAAEARAAPIKDAAAALKAPEAGPGSVDALFAALDALAGERLAAPLDAAVDALREPDFPVESDPDRRAEAAAKIAGVKDWRLLTLEAMHRPVVDEDAEFEAARGRFLDLPQSRPLAELRNALAQSRTDVPAYPDIVVPAAAGEAKTPASAADLAGLLDALDRESDMPTGRVDEMRSRLGEVDAKLRSSLPNLPGGGSAVESLLAALTPEPKPVPGPVDGEAALATAIGRRDSTLQDVEAMLDEQEAKAVAGLADMRRKLPVASHPKNPFGRSVAKRLGDTIQAAHRSGDSLRGRDMAGADLRGADLRGADLEAALLENADLAGACLAGVRLVGAALTGAVLDGADLSDCDLSEANLAKARAHGTRFSRSVFSQSLLFETDFTRAHFDDAVWSRVQGIEPIGEEADFAGASLTECILIKGRFDGATWRGAHLNRVQVIETTMVDASFDGARLHRCAFLRCKAKNVDFSNADLARCAFLGDADLSGACFTDALGRTVGFTGADLSGSTFTRARFDGCNFGRSDLSGADLRLASFKGSLFGRTILTGVDLLGANLMDAQLRRAALGGASLQGANLYGALLHDADLTGADLGGANLMKTMLDVDTNAG